MQPHSLTACLLLLGLCASEASARSATLKSVQVEPERVVLRLSRPVGFRSKVEGSPAAIIITLDDAELSRKAKNISGSGGLVRGVSTDQSMEGEVPHSRITILLDTARNYSPVWNGNDLAVEIQSVMLVKTTPAAAEPEPMAAAAPEPAVEARPVKKAPRARKTLSAKKAAPAAKPAPAAPRAGRAYWVQFGSLADEANAAQLKAELEPNLGKLQVRRAEVAGKTVYRVVRGPFAGRAAAKAALRKASGRPGLVIRD